MAGLCRAIWTVPARRYGDGVSADQPLPGLEAYGLGRARGVAPVGHRECVDPIEQGGVLRDWWEVAYEEWVEAYRRSQMPGVEPYGARDPVPLQDGEICDRCDELAAIATEHVWHQAPEVASLGGSAWRSGVLLWCAKHARENELTLLADGAVVVGVRGSR